jgi:LemA protein
MSKGVIAIVVVLIIALVFGAMYVNVKNELVRKDEAIRASWAQVDNVLKRRFDLIPNLVETVKGITAQEQAVFGEIARARAAMSGARTPNEALAANDRLSGALSRLLVVVENYPELKSNETFLRLMDELSGTENRIAVERQRYNEQVQAYNVFVKSFPNSIFAGWAGYQPKDVYMQTNAAEREAPKVDFSKPAEKK